MTSKSNDGTWVGDVIGGSLAALMSVPAAMAFGVLVFGSIGPSWTSKGVVAGLIAVHFWRVRKDGGISQPL